MSPLPSPPVNSAKMSQMQCPACRNMMSLPPNTLPGTVVACPTCQQRVQVSAPMMPLVQAQVGPPPGLYPPSLLIVFWFSSFVSPPFAFRSSVMFTLLLAPCPTLAGALVAETNGQFQEDFCGCMQDASNCCETFWCPCVTFGKTEAMLGGSYDNGCVYLCYSNIHLQRGWLEVRVLTYSSIIYVGACTFV